MKTTLFFSPNAALYFLIGFLGVLTTSCGSYQNSTYYDSDGIYGNTETKKKEIAPQDKSSNYYKEYFNSLQNNNNQSSDIFTNVANYSDANTSNDSVQRLNQDYADWGSNAGKTTINVYNNPTPWNDSLNFGWGYPYYGLGYNFGWSQPYYPWGYYANGWNYPYYTYGWNYPYSYGYCNYPYSIYGHSNYEYYNNTPNYSRSIGRRGSSFNSTHTNNSIHSRYSQNNATPNRSSNIGTYNTNNSFNSPRRVESQNQNYRSRTYSTGTRSSGNDNNNETRNTNARSENNPSGETETRSESTTPSRSYPSGSNNSRNSDSNDGGGRRSDSNGRR